MKKLQWRMYGLKIASFILSTITLGIPTLVKIINEQILILQKKIQDEINKETGEKKSGSKK